MLKLTLPILIATAVATAAPLAEDLRAVAEKNEADYRKAFAAQDASWFDRVAAPDFFVILVGGRRMNRAQSMAGITRSIKMGKVISITSKVLTVGPKGKGMVEVCESHAVISIPSQKRGKTSRIVDDTRYEEFWAKDGDVWHIHYQKILADKVTVDGKAVKT